MLQIKPHLQRGTEVGCTVDSQPQGPAFVYMQEYHLSALSLHIISVLIRIYEVTVSSAIT